MFSKVQVQLYISTTLTPSSDKLLILTGNYTKSAAHRYTWSRESSPIDQSSLHLQFVFSHAFISSIFKSKKTMSRILWVNDKDCAVTTNYFNFFC